MQTPENETRSKPDRVRARSRGVHFTAQYRERVLLNDGRLVTLRVLRAADRERYRRSFERTSDRARVARYLKPRQNLTNEEIDFLVTPHEDLRLGIGVFDRKLFGRHGDLLASVHLLRSDSDSNSAEFVIGAIDDAQQLGLGSLLMRRIAEAGLERGIRYLTFTMLSRNDPARRLFSAPPWKCSFDRQGDTTVGQIDLLPDPAVSPADSLETSPRPSIKEMIRRRKMRKKKSD